MTGRPRPSIAALPAYKPGRSAAAAEADHGVADAIKLASNEAPFGPLPSVAEAIALIAEEANLYPDHGAAELRADLARHLGIRVDQVTVGAGSAGILQQILLGFVEPGDEVAMCWPSFEAYPLFAQLVEAEQVRVPLRDETFDLPALAEAVTDRTKVAFITNPNNPTGTVVGTDEIVTFLDAVPATCIVVLDEAYDEFVTDERVTDSTRLLAEYPNLVITRTFSKAHGLAGLRVGYALGQPDVIGMIDRTLVPFAVNALAQAAARASLAAEDEMRERVAGVVAERSRVAAALRSAGWDVPEPQGNFVWLPLMERSADLGLALERRGVVTRVFDDVGIRVTVSDQAANDRFLTALVEAAAEET
ncbi:histidinol-phosphate transaminase [Ilumatobacter nonamiensis]|uniref:histidinol-phosphate transaminase n=1 Tax=Ilumatobacter nonamiensis TaxID=467093 RepID=UPI0003481122|nr:histidinol-phosphate transaminase [Ilumatobacter nonamiensis]